MLQSYKKSHELQDQYDYIVIGSGIGSLAFAAIMAKDGKKVLVLERHYTPGGYTHIFKRRGYEWDVGIHYIGEVGRERSLVRKMFDYISDGNLKWADMGDIYDRIVIGDEIFDFVKGTQNFKNQLKTYFPAPEDQEAIDKYVALVIAAIKTGQKFFMEKALPPLVSKIIGGRMRKDMLKYSRKTTLEVLSEITSNQKLITVLCGQYGDYGLPPSKSSFIIHAMVVRHYLAGGFFPVGGSSQVADTIIPVIGKAGGTVLVSAEVDEILIEKNKAVGVKMADGKIFKANTIVSGAGIFTTYNKMLPKSVFEINKLGNQLQKITPSAAHIALYIGLKGSPEELKLPKANYWVYPENCNHDKVFETYVKDYNNEFPVVYISFPSAKDPDWSNRYPGRSTIDIISVIPYDIFQKWEDGRWKKRGEDYDELKEKLSQRLLEALFKVEPHLRGKIDYYELSTPITTRHFVNYEKGEIYGLDHTPDRFEHRFLNPRTPIKNLWLTGQDIVTAGIGGALSAGLITASAIGKKNYIGKIMKG